MDVLRNIVWLSLLLCVAFASTACADNRYALLIGIADYEGTGLTSLDGTHNDVHLMAEVLRDDRFGFKDNVTVLLDEQATHSKLEEAFSLFAEQVKPGDIAYIHYSGHGSFTRDLNGDESSGLDQTWVSYRSRHPDAQDVDAYDILDDELNSWLAPIFAKAGQVILVSDSCHSGSVTRGAVKTRAAPLDNREHPLGHKSYPSIDLNEGVIVGAARDDEAAGEFKADDGQIYGLFTWYWGQSLLQARSGETWQDLFLRSSVQVTRERRAQSPQLMGNRSADSAFGGAIVSPQVRVPVKQVVGAIASIPVGSLSGVTAGSVYRKYEPGAEGSSTLPSLTITKVKPFFSTGAVSGELVSGDLLVEEKHAYVLEPLSVYVGGDYPEKDDREILQALKGVFASATIPGFVLTDDQAQSDMVLYLLRPKSEKSQLVYEMSEDSLPQSFVGQSPELWVLTATEDLLHENLKISFSDQRKGEQELKDALRKISRIREVKYLSSGSEPQIEVAAHVWEQAELCDPSAVDCIEMGDGEVYFQLKETLPAADMVSRPPSFNDLLTFTFKNTSQSNLYAYLLNIAPSGAVSVIFPPIGARADDAIVYAGKSLDTTKVRGGTGMLANELGEEMLKLVVSMKSIDISLLEQEGFQATRGVPDLGALLAQAVHGTRGKTVTIGRDEWGTKNVSFLIVE